MNSPPSYWIWAFIKIPTASKPRLHGLNRAEIRQAAVMLQPAGTAVMYTRLSRRLGALAQLF
jgi:hypothetical protein